MFLMHHQYNQLEQQTKQAINCDELSIVGCNLFDCDELQCRKNTFILSWRMTWPFFCSPDKTPFQSRLVENGTSPFPQQEKSAKSEKCVNVVSKSRRDVFTRLRNERERLYLWSLQFSVPVPEIDCLVTELLMTKDKPSRDVIRVVIWSDLQILVTQSCLLCWQLRTLIWATLQWRVTWDSNSRFYQHPQ